MCCREKKTQLNIYFLYFRLSIYLIPKNVNIEKRTSTTLKGSQNRMHSVVGPYIYSEVLSIFKKLPHINFVLNLLH